MIYRVSATEEGGADTYTYGPILIGTNKDNPPRVEGIRLSRDASGNPATAYFHTHPQGASENKNFSRATERGGQADYEGYEETARSMVDGNVQARLDGLPERIIPTAYLDGNDGSFDTLRSELGPINPKTQLRRLRISEDKGYSNFFNIKSQLKGKYEYIGK